jgi:hypothetical protein
MKAEALDKRLNELVAAGKITQKQADDYKAWSNSKPDDSAFKKSMQAGKTHDQTCHLELVCQE